MLITCPKCKRELIVDETGAVSTVRCPNCATKLQITTLHQLPGLAGTPGGGSDAVDDSEVTTSGHGGRTQRILGAGNLLFCRDCGGTLSRNALACPHCGAAGVAGPDIESVLHESTTPVQGQARLTGKQEYGGLALAGFICSLVGVFLFGLILGIVGLVLSSVALSGMKRVGNHNGKGFATAGLVIGIVDVGLWLALIANFMEV